MGIIDITGGDQAAPRPGIHIPDRPGVPNLERFPQATKGPSQRRPLAQEQTPKVSFRLKPSEITDPNFARLWLGTLNPGNGGADDKTLSSIRGTLGYPILNSLENRKADAAIQSCIQHLVDAGGILDKVDPKGIHHYVEGDRRVLEQLAAQKPTGDSAQEQADAAKRIAGANAALERHFEALRTTQPSAPTEK